MLEHLRLKNVGPAPEMEFEPTPRVNLITGDNGLGKSFLLEIAWWVLSRTWTRDSLPARPSEAKMDASIAFRFEGKQVVNSYESTFDRESQSWKGKKGRPPNPGLVLYARVDGGFSLWDPARNYWRQKGRVDLRERPAAYRFHKQDIWDGLEGEEGNVLCNGLVLDWVLWQRAKSDAFNQLSTALAKLSPSDDEPLVAGEPTRISLDEVRDIPTLRMTYGQEVPILHASAGMQRVVSLAYLLVWAWQEHRQASKLLGQEPARQVIFLVDEIEAHLHPRWQRLILRSLLEVVNALAGAQETQVQILCATHSPLVLASAEPYFDEARDSVWELDLRKGTVELRRSPWRRRGDVNNWLSSPVFDLAEPRSVEAERAIGRALELLRDPQPTRDRILDVDEELRTVLGDVDRFWIRWSSFAERWKAG